MPETLDVPVGGGSLHVTAWEGRGVPVLAIHGITSSGWAWPFLAAELEQTLVAPDLRGRGRSNALPGPYGLAAHAADCAAVVEAVSDGPVVVVGHSMGGFVATVLAARRPDLVLGVVLVDGGLPFDAADEAAIVAGLEPIRRRLHTTYTRAEYRDWFRRHPAFAHDYTPEVQAYADHDLPVDPGRPSVVPEVVEADQVDMLRSTAFTDALVDQTRPRIFLHASRGFADDPPGLYPQSVVDGYAERWPDLDVRLVPDVNHYTIVLSSRGAAAVAGAVADLG